MGYTRNICPIYWKCYSYQVLFGGYIQTKSVLDRISSSSPSIYLSPTISSYQWFSFILLNMVSASSKCLQLLAQLPHTGTLWTDSRVPSTYGGRLCDARTKTSFWTVNRCSTDQLLGIGHYTIGYSILISVCILPRNWFDRIVFQ